jgi:hypothetical protein
MSYFFLASVAGLAALGVAQFSSSGFAYTRATGAYRAKVFDIRQPPPLHRDIVARVAGSLAPALVPVLLFWAVLWTTGQDVPTNQVRIEEGPARRAGMQDGDRIVAIDGHVTRTWEEVRIALQARHTQDPKGQWPAVRVIGLDRAGVALNLSVTPDSGGYMRVIPINRKEPLGPLAAATEAFAMPPRIVGDLLRAIPDKDSTYVGPIDIVKETSKTADSAAFLWFIAALGAYFAPAFLVAHLVDATTLRLFLKLNPDAIDAHDEAHRRPWRLARLRQLLILLIAAYGVAGLLWIVSGAPTGVILFIQVWLGPLFPTLVWILARDLSGRVLAALTLLAMAVPFLNLFVAWRVSATTATFLRNQGLRPGWLRVSQNHSTE